MVLWILCTTFSRLNWCFPHLCMIKLSERIPEFIIFPMTRPFAFPEKNNNYMANCCCCCCWWWWWWWISNGLQESCLASPTCGPIASSSWNIHDFPTPRGMCRRWIGAVQPLQPLGSKRYTTVDGWNPAPVDMVDIPLFTGVYTSQVVQDFFHQQYLKC